MRTIFCLLFFPFFLAAQATEEELLFHREQHAIELSDTTYGVLTAEEIVHFGGVDYFPFNRAFQLEATFEVDKGKKFKMPTSTDRKPWYRRYGYITFQVQGKTYSLTAYQNLALKKSKEFKNYLFVPFRDLTSGISTYGGGRYLDLHIPDGTTLILDFNTAYNPYCAYSYRYSCPIPPSENTLPIAIPAGEKTPLESN